MSTNVSKVTLQVGLVDAFITTLAADEVAPAVEDRTLLLLAERAFALFQDSFSNATPNERRRFAAERARVAIHVRMAKPANDGGAVIALQRSGAKLVANDA